MELDGTIRFESKVYENKLSGDGPGLAYDSALKFQKEVLTFLSADGRLAVTEHTIGEPT